MVKKSNKLAKKLAITSGVLLLMSGTTGVASLKMVESWISGFMAENSLILFIFAVLMFIASFGGITVIIGGILIGKGKVTIGSLLVKLGSGASVLGLLFSLVVGILTKSFVLGSMFSMASAGIVLSIIATSVAKK